VETGGGLCSLDENRPETSDEVAKEATVKKYCYPQ